MNIFTMLSSSRGSKIWNVIKFSNYKSSVLHTELRVSTLVLFIIICIFIVLANGSGADPEILEGSMAGHQLQALPAALEGSQACYPRIFSIHHCTFPQFRFT